MLVDNGIDPGKGKSGEPIGAALGVVGAAAEVASRVLQEIDPWIKQTAKAGGKEWIAQYDGNKDGKVTTDEYANSELRKTSKERAREAGDLARMLMLADSNNDNKLSMNELSKKVNPGVANIMMRDGDNNNDGFLDFGEANKLFAKNLEEHQKMQAHFRFQEFDRNHNGVATVDEATKAIENRLLMGPQPNPPGGEPAPGSEPGGQQGSGGGPGRGQDQAPQRYPITAKPGQLKA